MSKSLKKLIDINRLREFKNKLVGTDSPCVQTGAVDQIVAGTKTFSKPIAGSVTGSSGSCTGNAATATTAATAESCTGNAATATKLATARSLWGNNFDGSAAITGPIMGTPAIELMPPATSNHGGFIDFHYKHSTADFTSRIIEIASGTLSINDVTITTEKVVTATTFNGALEGNVTGNCSGSSGSCTGNAATATELQTARTINGTGFDGTANITTANWGTARDITIADSTGDNTGEAVSVNGSAAVTLKLPATIKANLTGNCSGSSGSCTGNAATATTATTATDATYANWLRTSSHSDHLFHTEWDGAYFWTYVTAGDGGYRAVRVARSDSSGNADTATNATYANWLRTSSHSDCLFHTEWDGSYFWTYVTADDGGYRAVRVARSDSSGNADTATKLATARTIALSGAATGTATGFDGSGNITIPVTSLDASKLTGTASVSTTGNAATATTATTAKSCTGNAATATKLATARTIALSGAATGTATSFDGSGNITIPVTALSPSAIRAQWYAAYPDGAEAHNAMWGGRDITADFDAGTVSANIANGTFKDIFPGDYITKQVTISGTAYTVNWVVADCDYWINKGDQNNGMETHHVAIVPQAPIFNYPMNGTNNTVGGYVDSRMYTGIIPDCATGIVNAFGADHILTFRDGISNSVDTSHVSSGIPQWTGTPDWWGTWVSVQCNLMSEKMVYGAPICAAGAMDNTMATRQMSAFRLSERLINYNRQIWWLRDVVSSTNFAFVGSLGRAVTANASNVYGVRPFALLV